MADLKIKKFPRMDRRLDWISKHDPRSRDYPLRSAITPTLTPFPKRWTPGLTLDQGQEGACVGFGWTQELLTSPRPYATSVELATLFAQNTYRRAKEIDEWPGEDYDGSSVLAGAKTQQERGFITEYRWCFSIDEVRDAVMACGPVVIGIPWLSGMYDTRPSGLVEVDGAVVGGHCILIDEYHPGKRLSGEDYYARFHGFGWHNSWGHSYGVAGRGFIRYEDLRDLLADSGEACVPMGRKQVKF